MKLKKLVIVILLATILSSCIVSKKVRYSAPYVSSSISPVTVNYKLGETFDLYKDKTVSNGDGHWLTGISVLFIPMDRYSNLKEYSFLEFSNQVLQRSFESSFTDVNFYPIVDYTCTIDVKSIEDQYGFAETNFWATPFMMKVNRQFGFNGVYEAKCVDFQGRELPPFDLTYDYCYYKCYDKDIIESFKNTLSSNIPQRTGKIYKLTRKTSKEQLSEAASNYNSHKKQFEEAGIDKIDALYMLASGLNLEKHFDIFKFAYENNLVEELYGIHHHGGFSISVIDDKFDFIKNHNLDKAVAIKSLYQGIDIESNADVVKLVGSYSRASDSATVIEKVARNEIIVDGHPVYSEQYKSKPYKQYNYVNYPIKTIEILVNQSLNDFLTLKDNPVRIPPVVQKPQLPASVNLTKDQYESTKSFMNRVEKAQAKRKDEILALQNAYRKKVEFRNSKIQEYENIALQRRDSAEAYKKVFMYDAMNHVLASFKMSNPSYNPDNEQMKVTLTSTKSSYKKDVVLRVPEGEIARDFAENISKIPVSVTFAINDNSIEIKDVEARRGVLVAKADMKAGNFVKAEPMAVVVKNDVKFIEENQKQNPNLVDTSNINIVVYEKTKDNFKDDLPSLLAKAKKATPDKNKWLIAIGAEAYDGTDKVIYSARSAEMFTQVASKVLGVPSNHIYSAIGEKATAGTIKTGMNRMLENVGADDTVYFYYSGHGIPILPENDPYILPKDIVPDFIAQEQFFKLQNIYKMLSDSKAKSVIALVDSCFSGATDGESVYKGAAATRLKPKKVTFDTSKMVVLTAGTDKQFSNMYADKGHRLFSYFVMKSILAGHKDVKTVYHDIYNDVSEVSFDIGGDNRKQEPVMQGNADLKL